MRENDVMRKVSVVGLEGVKRMIGVRHHVGERVWSRAR